MGDQTKRIYLVVVDDKNAPVGIVDSQDLTRLKLL